MKDDGVDEGDLVDVEADDREAAAEAESEKQDELVQTQKEQVVYLDDEAVAE